MNKPSNSPPAPVPASGLSGACPGYGGHYLMTQPSNSPPAPVHASGLSGACPGYGGHYLMTRPSNSPPAPVPASGLSGACPGYGGHLVGLTLAGLVVYTTWFWAGLRPSFHLPVMLLALACLLGLALSAGAAARKALLREPLFWLGLSFLGYLTVQWANAGRTLYYDVGFNRWVYTSARWPDWPSAFSRPEARQMFDWFFPAWVAALAVRSTLMPSRTVRMLLRLIVYSAGLLALFGVVQFTTKTSAIYWMLPLECPFFASFPYSNHAAAYFILTAALSAGLLLRELFRTDQPLLRGRAVLLGAGLLLGLTAANLSLSRAGVILAWSFGCFAVGYGVMRGWSLLKPVGRLRLVVITACASMLFFFVVSGVAAKAIRREFFPAAPQASAGQPALTQVNLAMPDRPLFARAAWAMWKDHPWLGVGGWGFKRLAASYVPADQWPKLAKSGWANVHLDGLQFLAEFGAIGFGLLAGAAGVLVFPILPPRLRFQPLWVMGVAGLGLVVLLSLIDIPFRCPAILYTWVVILAALPKACGAHRHTRLETPRA